MDNILRIEYKTLGGQGSMTLNMQNFFPKRINLAEFKKILMPMVMWDLREPELLEQMEDHFAYRLKYDTELTKSQRERMKKFLEVVIRRRRAF